MPLNGLFVFVWAGKDVANSESAVKLLSTTKPATGHLVKGSGIQRY
jgi:hypothetical protein